MKNTKVIKIISILLIFIILCNDKSKSELQKCSLKFNKNGEFKIVQFSDLHEHTFKDKKTINLMESILDTEKPDLVILTGDNIDGRFLNKKNVKDAISEIAKPMEKRKIYWAAVLGNHDCERCHVNRRSQMNIYMSYKHNLCNNYSNAVDRSGDYNLLIMDSQNKKPVFNIYMMDSGSYYRGGYGYIKKEQVTWYKNKSKYLRKINGNKIPSLMFFHIALKEQHRAWESKEAIGNRYEIESTQKINSNMLKAIIEMNDVKGVFVGHDHTNDYMGKIRGIKFGYGRCTGYNNYPRKKYLRGARIFIINEKKPANFITYEKLEQTN